MVVIYVPEDKRWDLIGQGLGKGVGGLLAGWAEGRVKQGVANELQTMSQDPKYANAPERIYADIEAKYPGFGGSQYLKSMDASLKFAQIKELGQRHGLDDLRAQRLRQQIEAESDPVKKAKLAAELEKILRENRIGAATEPARIEQPGAALEGTRARTTRTRQEIKAGEQSGTGRRELVAPPESEPEPETTGDQSSLLPGEAGRQLTRFAQSRQAGGAGSGGTQVASLTSPDVMSDVPIGPTLTDPLTTLGPAEHPLQVAQADGGPPIMPSLQGSIGGGRKLSAPLPTPPSATRAAGPAQVPGPNLAPPAQPSVRQLQPAAGVAPSTLGAAPAGSEAPPVPTAAQVPPGSAAASQPLPTGLALEGSPEYKVQADTVKARVNQKLQNELRAVGITHPQEIMRVYDAISQSDDLHWQQAYHTTVNDILRRHAQAAEAGQREAGIERRHTETLDQQRDLAQQRLKQAQDHFDKNYNAPRMMPPEMRNRLTADSVAIEGLVHFLEPGVATGGVTAGIKKWMNDHGVGTDPNFARLSTEADQAIVSSALTGGGFGGMWRGKLAELSNPDVRHYNYIDVLKIGAISGRAMRSLATLHDELAVDPHQQANLPTINKMYAQYKELYDKANSLWWGQERDPRTGQLTDNYHFYYEGREVDRNLKPIQGPTSIPDAGAHYRLKSNPEVSITGAELAEEARKRGVLPSQMMGQNWQLVQ